MGKSKRDLVQIRNPRADRYVKIDRDKGEILSVKKTKGPYKNITIKDTVKKGY